MRKTKRHNTFYFQLEKPEETIGVKAKDFAVALVRVEREIELSRVTSVWTGVAHPTTILEGK